MRPRCHNDTHLENIFFHERFPGGCAFIDFGNVFFGHGLSDVAFFISTCLEPEVRSLYLCIYFTYVSARG